MSGRSSGSLLVQMLPRPAPNSGCNFDYTSPIAENWRMHEEHGISFVLLAVLEVVFSYDQMTFMINEELV